MVTTGSPPDNSTFGVGRRPGGSSRVLTWSIFKLGPRPSLGVQSRARQAVQNGLCPAMSGGSSAAPHATGALALTWLPILQPASAASVVLPLGDRAVTD